MLAIVNFATSQIIINLLKCYVIISILAVNTVIYLFDDQNKTHKYFLDPVAGSDQNSGTDKRYPWKSFKPLNKLILAEGSIIEIIRPGTFHESLVINAKGTKSNPVKVIFAPGRYDLFPDSTLKLPLHISNTNVKPYQPKALAIFVTNSSYTTIKGCNAIIYFRGKMIETYINNSTNISVEGLTYDYYRPTVSELKVISTQNRFADLKIHRDSKFIIQDSCLIWKGEGWMNEAGYLWQKLDLTNDIICRLPVDMSKLKFISLGGDSIRVLYQQNPGFVKNCIYQNRQTERDCAGIFIQHSKNIVLSDLKINFMHGMGIVGQMCENIKINNIAVKPAKSSGRTCAAWADILHFSGCRGIIDIKNNYLSAANDDAINVHGTYLKVIAIIKPNIIRLQFMHPETYGFNPYLAGDSIEFVKQSTLLPHHTDIVLKSRMINDRQVEVVLGASTTNAIAINDYVENISATPSVNIYNNTITRIPTRGILVTTRRKVKIWNNKFQKTYMSGILVSDDASSWYESGRSMNLSIENNRFNFCGEPVINIAPENVELKEESVHHNVSVFNNVVLLRDRHLLSAKSTSNLYIKKNVAKQNGPPYVFKDLIELNACKDVEMSKNKVVKH